MTAMKTKVISGIGLLTVLINVVSSQLLYTAQILNHIPDYDKLTGKNGEGEFLDYQFLNDRFRLLVSYDPESNGFRLNVKSAEFVKSRSQRRASLEIIPEEPNSCGKTPGIKASPRKLQSSCLNCIASNTPNKESTSKLTSREYCFTEMRIKVKNWLSTPSLMKLSLKFYDKEKKHSIRVYMILFETPTTKDDIKLKEKHNVFVVDTIPFIQELSKLTPGIREVLNEVVYVKDTIPWLKDVLDRAKYIKSVKPKTMFGTYTDWYYAGALETNPEILKKILNLDSRWKQYIRRA